MTVAAEKAGLDGIIIGDTQVSLVQQTGLWYRGYAVEDLAEHSTFEETAYLVLYGELPDEEQLRGFSSRLFAARAGARVVFPILDHIPRSTPLMDVLRTAVSVLGHYDADTDHSCRDSNTRKAERLMGQVAEIIPAWMRRIEGKSPIPAHPGLSHAAQMLYQLHGEIPNETAARTIDLTLILYAEHEFNASTFVARTTASTLSDLHSAVVAAIGALKGPLHGGANEKAMDIFEAMNSPEHAAKWVDEQIAQKKLIMGFGHRVYKNGDHRAVVLGKKAKELASQRDDRDWAGIYQVMVDKMLAEKGMHPNLDFPCGLAYLLLGLKREICTPLFVASRLSGWCAHIIEQHEHNRLIRPLSRYTGAEMRKWKPVQERG